MLRLVDAGFCLVVTDWGRCITVTGSLKVTEGKLAFGSLVGITYRVVGGTATCNEDGKEYEIEVELALDHLFSTGVTTCGFPQSGLGCIFLKDCMFLFGESTTPVVIVLI